MPFFLTYINRSWSLAKTPQKRCYRARTSGTYQTSTGESHQMTLASETTLTTPRQDKMLADCLRLLYTTEPPLPGCLSKLNWWWKHIRKPNPGSGEGVFDRLLEHRFKPSPSSRTISVDAFAYYICLSYILDLFLWFATSQRS
jgi:hypothetical protein